MFDLDKVIDTLSNCQLPSENEVKTLCDHARDILVQEENVAILSTPITVCGDIHGQFEDLMELFRIGGDIPETNYIFMGDFVDRGYHSVETFLLLLSLKVKYPEHIVVLRGNHESRQITQVYGFYDECVKKFGSVNIWKLCTDVFDYLPLAAVIDGKIYCVHGGLSPNAEKIDDIRRIERKVEVPHEGAMSDMLWSDPDPEAKGFAFSPRGAGYLFGAEEVNKFNYVNGIELIARAHQLIMDGYQMMFNDALVTVWSAPNYCYRCGNIASVMEFDEHLNRSFKKFEAAPVEVRSTETNNAANKLDYFL